MKRPICIFVKTKTILEQKNNIMSLTQRDHSYDLGRRKILSTVLTCTKGV